MIHSLSHPIVKISLRHGLAQTIKSGASSHKTKYIDIVSEIFILEEHQNRLIDSKVTAILLTGWMMPTGGVASGSVCACSLHSRLFSQCPSDN